MVRFCKTTYIRRVKCTVRNMYSSVSSNYAIYSESSLEGCFLWPLFQMKNEFRRAVDGWNYVRTSQRGIIFNFSAFLSTLVEVESRDFAKNLVLLQEM